ncbi:response regulator transcription factor [Phycicoccus sp. BSK3Z-2]|uniref:Response regulator transcription factor n=1 Tax=Phycicoccus avicenniae TaxID=2828860 RepID=A0A941DA59_9MICO|nr:response regulator transcription factor [Phycicoccus avicenniae]MBR7744326.1 response regulator transcription factor [Phycicoccus avicenniae]
MTHVLVIEDDPSIRASLVRSLTDRGHAVASAPTGLVGLQEALDTRPDLVLLDLGLPDLDGQSLLSMLRAVRQTPVIVVTARDDDTTVVKALDTGADDYVVKPFTMDQLEARMRAVLRRSDGAAPDDAVAVGDLVAEPAARRASLRGTELDLTRREFDLLVHLMRRPGEVVRKRDLLTEVWNLPYGGSERTVDVHLSWLRRKLGESAAHPVYLHSVRGVGVRLTAPEDGSRAAAGAGGAPTPA